MGTSRMPEHFFMDSLPVVVQARPRLKFSRTQSAPEDRARGKSLPPPHPLVDLSHMPPHVVPIGERLGADFTCDVQIQNCWKLSSGFALLLFCV